MVQKKKKKSGGASRHKQFHLKKLNKKNIIQMVIFSLPLLNHYYMKDHIIFNITLLKY